MSTPPQPSRPPEPGGSSAPQPTPTQPAFPAQPTAYSYPGPQSQPAGPYGGPLPGQPQQGNPYAQPGPYGPPYARPAGGGGGGAGRAVLWALAGAAVASAGWAVAVLLTGGTGTSADLRGYRAPADLCTGADYSSFQDAYTAQGAAPTHSSLRDKALDEGFCSVSLKRSGSSYTDAYLAIQVDLHHKTDPAPEFTATWKHYDDSHTGYDVTPVSGIGDEAYLVSQDTTSGSSSGSRYDTLAVRDGWMTYTMSYSAYLSSLDQDKNPPRISEVSDWLKTDTKATLEKLRD